MKTLKILQDWPLRHDGKELNRGDIAELDDKSADWLLAHNRAELVKSPETSGQTAAQTAESPKTGEKDNQTERQAKIQEAVNKMLTANPATAPKCPDIAAATGLQNIRKEERDAAVAAFKEAQTGNETAENKGE
ncbi:MAG: hypothetical protein OSJ76_05760 [Alphaproteobacteria bacterium]|nr:hypothetical protein [Alphaproteobacteria bacterium]